jgi:DNA-binding protein HU-beta
MTKSEIVALMAQSAGITKKAAGAVLNSIVGAVHESLKKADSKIRIADLGTFSVTKRKARAGVNPRTGKKITIPAMKVPRFSASRALKEAAKASDKKKK